MAADVAAAKIRSRYSDFINMTQEAFILFERIATRAGRRIISVNSMRILLNQFIKKMLGVRPAMELIHNALVGNQAAFTKMASVVDKNEAIVLDFIYTLLTPSWAFYYLAGVRNKKSTKHPQNV